MSRLNGGSNSQRIYAACKAFAGKVLSADAIKGLVSEQFGVAPSQVYPSDAAHVDARYGHCVLAKSGSGFRVLAESEIVLKPTTRSASGSTDPERFAKAASAAKAALAAQAKADADNAPKQGK